MATHHHPHPPSSQRRTWALNTVAASSVLAIVVMAMPPGGPATVEPVEPATTVQRTVPIGSLPAPLPTLPPATSSTSTTSSTTSTSTTTTTTVAVPAGARCPEALALAASVGWPADALPTLDRVVWGESRCQPTAHNDTPPDDSRGLMQINVLGSLWPDRQARCGLDHPDELFDAATNLACGLVLWQSSGWQPWAWL